MINQLTQLQLAKIALRKLESIPGEDFLTNAFTDEVSKCCSIGHIMRTERDPDNYSYSNCTISGISETTVTNMIHWSELGSTIMSVNDNTRNEYIDYGKSPKERVVNYLKSLR